MLLERGASTVICFDITPPDSVLQERFDVVQKKTSASLLILSGADGDITSAEAVNAAFEAASQIDVVYHIAALVGPFHDRSKYEAVNYYGTMYVLQACQKYNVPKLVYSSSPSTRFTGADIDGLREDQLPIPDKFLALYAETKAQAEKQVAAACGKEGVLTISVAPHQVYGPYDSLFFPKLMETAGTGCLRIFGTGDNMISVCFVDNYCHCSGANHDGRKAFASGEMDRHISEYYKPSLLTETQNGCTRINRTSCLERVSLGFRFANNEATRQETT